MKVWRRAIMLCAVSSLPIEAAAAANWCSVSHDGATNCSFESMELCRANVSGIGGFCIPQAPIGHRQPRASDLPASPAMEAADARQQQRNRTLDRSLQLCRGC